LFLLVSSPNPRSHFDILTVSSTSNSSPPPPLSSSVSRFLFSFAHRRFVLSINGSPDHPVKIRHLHELRELIQYSDEPVQCRAQFRTWFGNPIRNDHHHHENDINMDIPDASG
jgi:ribosomal protein L16 Arg81 hydroxylase